MHTASELKHLLLLWKSVEAAWEKDDHHSPRVRTFKAIGNTRGKRIVHLVEGGRWLLIMETGTAAVTYYDLDADTISGTLLIPAQMKSAKSTTERVIMSVDVDANSESPTWAFRIALSIHNGTLLSGPPSRVQRVVRIWDVNLILDASQRIAGLCTSPVASFPHSSALAEAGDLSLLGNNIAFRGRYHRDDRQHLFVIDWTKTTDSCTYPWRVVHTFFHDSPICWETPVHLLPGNKLVAAVLLRKIMVFDYSKVKETLNISIQGSFNSSIRETDLGRYSFYIRFHLSTLTTSQRVFNAYYKTFNSIEDGDLSPEIVDKLPDLISTGDYGCLAMGFTHAVSFRGNGEVKLMLNVKSPQLRSQDKNSGRRDNFVIHKKAEYSVDTYLIQQAILDEQSGRALLVPTDLRKHAITVIDFALSLHRDS